MSARAFVKCDLKEPFYAIFPLLCHIPPSPVIKHPVRSLIMKIRLRGGGYDVIFLCLGFVKPRVHYVQQF